MNARILLLLIAGDNPAHFIKAVSMSDNEVPDTLVKLLSTDPYGQLRIFGFLSTGVN